MRQCLLPSSRPQRLGHRPSCYLLPLIRRLSISLSGNVSTSGTVTAQQRLSAPVPPSRALPLRDYAQSHMPKIPIYVWKRKSNRAWIGWLERYLPRNLRGDPMALNAEDSELAGDVLAQARELLHILAYARRAKGDPLAYLGFAEGRWPAVYALLTTLLDAADSIRDECVHRQPMSNLDWGSNAGFTIDQLTGSHNTPTPWQVQVSDRSTVPISLDALTNRPFGNDLTELLIGQVLLSLGEIVFNAADASRDQSMTAMPYVYRLLARMHHSGMVPDKVYTYAVPDRNDTLFRPPAMQLLSTHIMSILSDAAWVEHEPKVTAEGEKSPFLPFKMGVRELGPEIWMEFILWCCVESGVTDAIYLLKRIRGRKGEKAWHLQSWRPLLDHSEAVWKTNIDLEETWRGLGTEEDKPRQTQDRAAFHGLGKRTISTEVALSLMTGAMNKVYVGMGWRGLTPRHIITDIRRLRQIIAQGPENVLEPTTKAINTYIFRFLESGALDADYDPHTMEALLDAHPYVVPPWIGSQYGVHEPDHLSQTQIYNETSAFTGMMEYNIGLYAANSQTELALGTFNKLLAVVDESKRQNINRTFERLGRLEPDTDTPFFNAHYLTRGLLESCIPQMSNATFAKLLDVARSSKEYGFAKWLLSNDDIDGPAILPSAYGDQALAPALLRLATETGDMQLYERIVQSVSQPLSLNTLRALLNAQIARGEWEHVIGLFEFMRDFRAKAWGFSNISALALTILKIDHILKRTVEAPPPGARDSLDRAKNILLRVLNGEFGTPHHVRIDNYYPLAIYGFQKMLASIPGPLSDVAKQANIRSYGRLSKASFPILPTEPFNDLLSAVVETQGSAAGKYLWNRWLVTHPALNNRRRHQGGINRLYTRAERDRNKGDPVFDESWFNGVRWKMAFPNLSTVRIISRKAVEEYASWSRTPQKAQQGKKNNTQPSADGDVAAGDMHSPWPTDDRHTGDEKPLTSTKDTPEDVLDFCVLRFKNLNLADSRIDVETNGHLTRMRTDRKLIRRPRRRRAKFREGYPPGWSD